MATALAGEQLVKAPTTLVRSVTGFAIGRVSPFGHLKPIKTFFVIDLMKITPKSTSSKILLHYSSCCYNSLATGFVVSTIYKNITSSTDGQTAISGGTDLSNRGATGYGMSYFYSESGTQIVPLTSQFYVTAPQICPYLEGRMERKLFTSLQGTDSSNLNNALSKQGFRRSQNVLYRPACVACTACLSARIDVDNFFSSKSHRRIIKRNAHLQRQPNAPWATETQYELFRSYLESRHSEGGMADMDIFEFAAMIEETPVTSR